MFWMVVTRPLAPVPLGSGSLGPLANAELILFMVETPAAAGTPERVTKVSRGTPAYECGLSVDDELIAIDGFRVRADQLGARLENYAPGQRVELIVARREKMIRLEMVLGEEPGRAWQLEVRPNPSTEQKGRLKDWLGR